MNDALTLDYVNAAAALLRLPLAPAQAVRVAAHLQRTVAMAALLDDVALTPPDELAEIYCPAVFPVSDPEDKRP